MFKKIHLFIVVILWMISIQAPAQKLLKKAEIQADAGELDKAVQNFKAYLKDNPNDYIAISKLAEACATQGDLNNADLWYEKIPTNADVNPYVFKNHGDVLKKMMRYEEALKKFTVFKSFQSVEGEQAIQSCEYAMKSMSSGSIHDIFVMPSNSSSSDFSLTFYKGMPVFSSFREDILMTEAERELNTDNISHKSFLYNSQKNRLGYIKGINGNINHLGPLSFSNDGSKCALIEAKIKDNYNLVRTFQSSSVHLAEVNDKGEITSAIPFAHNEVGSCINSVHLAFDGSAIYFSSNRKGGYGGYDIYVSYLNENTWTIPENMGSSINSEGNEITPFLYENALYFASDYHLGLGGFDILKSEAISGKWSAPINLGNGVNSPADDYYPVYNDKDELYVTSNRLGGKGNNDIYKTYKLAPNPVKTEEYADIPKAVSLDDLAAETQLHTVNSDVAMKVAMNETTAKAVSFTLPEFDPKKVGSNANAELSMEGAHRIALEALIPNTEVFFIQLASMSSSKPNFSKFKPLLRYGNIYKMLNEQTIKVRLGYFTDRKEAEEILTKVRANGYKDAFLAYEILNTARMELIMTGTDEESFTDNGNFNTRNPEVAKSYKEGNKYKVRLASYEDPIWFDVNKVKDLGRIEQWTKGGWTIFILAGYNDLGEAKKAQIQANNRGFKTAEVVIDNGGILERLKKN